MLERGDADLLVTPDVFISTEHPSTLLFEDKYVVVACAKGPLKDVEMDMELYQKTPHAIMVPPGLEGTPAEGRMLQAAGVTRNVDLTTFSFSTLPHLIVGTRRIATVHSHIARVARQSADLVTYPLPFETPPFRQMLQWHSYREHDPGLAWLRSVFQTAAGRLPSID
jgi:DNA-binding transcriptional LysR family regulator